jgi:hypothetical protein
LVGREGFYGLNRRLLKQFLIERTVCKRFRFIIGYNECYYKQQILHNIRYIIDKPVGFSFLSGKIFCGNKEKERCRHVNQYGNDDPKGLGRIDKGYFHIGNLFEKEAYTEDNDEYGLYRSWYGVKIIRLVLVEEVVQHQHNEQRGCTNDDLLNAFGLDTEVEEQREEAVFHYRKKTEYIELYRVASWYYCQRRIRKEGEGYVNKNYP